MPRIRESNENRSLIRFVPDSLPGVQTVALFLLFFASGAAALIYEVLWLKELGRLFGVTAYAAATTLAVFFLGLSAGGFAWGRHCAKAKNPLRLYGFLELGIAVTALQYFLLLDLYEIIFGPLYLLLGDNPALFLFMKFLLATGVLFLPAFLMGGTLPVMGQFLVRSREQFGKTASLLYAINTIGAAAGAMLGGVVLPSRLGFRNSYMVPIVLNILIGVVAIVWSRGASDPVKTKGTVAASAKGSMPSESLSLNPKLIWLAAVVSGFITLGLEVVWTRMYAQVLQNSVYTFAIILTVFLAALSLGSGLANFLCRRQWPPSLVLFGLLSAAGLLVGLTPYLFYRSTEGLEILGSGMGWESYIGSVFLRTASILLVPGVLIGSVFPYLMKLCEGRMISPGKTIGQLASANTFAAILGAVTAGFVFLNVFGLWGSMRVFAVLYLLLSIITLIGTAKKDLRLSATSLTAAIPVTGILLFAFVFTYSGFAKVYLEPDSDETLVEAWEGSHGTVVVVRRGDDLRIKVNNSYLLGTSQSAMNLRLQAWLPICLHPDPRSVFFLGMGTGITAGAALALPLEEVVVSELNADVVRASRKHFAPYLYGLFDDPRAEVLVEDGRTFLRSTSSEYDLIIADIFLTYKAGVGDLYTIEHFEAARSRLAEGGFFVQWLPVFDFAPREFGIVARTMLAVFPQVTLWRRGFSPKFPVFALIGQNEISPLDPSILDANLSELEGKGLIPPQLWLRNIPFAAYAGNLSLMNAFFEEYPLNTDDRTPLEYLSPITERESKGARLGGVMAWKELADYCEMLLKTVPPETDEFLENVDSEKLRQVRAGLAYYRFEVAQRLEQHADSQRALEEFQSLVGDGGEAQPD